MQKAARGRPFACVSCVSCSSLITSKRPVQVKAQQTEKQGLQHPRGQKQRYRQEQWPSVPGSEPETASQQAAKPAA